MGVLLLLTILICLMIYYVLRKHKCWLASPTFWIFFGFSFITILNFCGFVEYSYPARLTGYIFLWSCFVVFTVGVKFGKKHLFVFGKARNFSNISSFEELTVKDERIQTIEKKKNGIYLLMLTVGLIVYIIDFVLNDNITSSGSSLHSYLRLSKIGVIAGIITKLGLVIWLREISISIRENKKIKLSAIYAVFVFMVPGLLTSGRQQLIITLVSTIAILFLSLNKNKAYKYRKQMYLFAGIAVVAFVGFATITALSRSGYADTQIAFYEATFGFKTSESFLQFIDDTGFLGKTLFEIVSYYSHELPNLQFLLDEWNAPFPFLGASQFTLISTNLPDSFYFSDPNLWSYIEEMYASTGRYEHVWRTLAGDCYIDYGVFGSYIFLLFLGVLAGNYQLKVNKYARVNDEVVLSIICAGCLFAMQYSPFSEGYFYFPLIWIAVLPLIDSLFFKRIK